MANATLAGRLVYWRNPPDRIRGHLDWHTFYIGASWAPAGRV